MMATAEECRTALESLTARISGMDPADRAAHLADRTVSCRVPDLGLMFVTRLSPDGPEPVKEAAPGDQPAQVRFTANSDDLVAVAADPGSLLRAWLGGHIKIEASIMDLIRLRKLF
jgi:hypothetical protein